MKLTINTSSSTLTSSQHLIILTDAENLEQPATGYQFNELKALIDATQFKGSLNECLPLIAQTSAHQNAVLLGLDKVSEFKTAKLAKSHKLLLNLHKKIQAHHY